MSRAKIGDIIRINVSKGFKLAKIVWISTSLKDVFAFTLLNSDEVNCNAPYNEIELPKRTVRVIYADIKNVNNGIWPVVGYCDFTEKDQQLIHHMIGGTPYIGDTPCTDTAVPLSAFHTVRVSGDKAVENLIDYFISNQLITR
ncbi:Imm26 family immunity protein [Motilimonas sp. E26]|uniref:Imm26 family immunity protein n=1 Tax=Motilimonas sp. E26 TaxID=2865674 RepID=UPI001E372557|nr:Imm26 family immunity protein [Motilimonas sp. E26]MCE0559316.1 immunity 26/phosphotriesterase HocA family protein [Motilimonas sp. E26]